MYQQRLRQVAGEGRNLRHVYDVIIKLAVMFCYHLLLFDDSRRRSIQFYSIFRRTIKSLLASCSQTVEKMKK